MKNRDQGGVRATKVAATALLSLMLLVPTTWLFLAYNNKYRQCITLKNGLNLGYEAVLDLSRPYFKPIAVPRFTDGTPLIHDELWAIFVTDTSVYGVSMAGEDGLGHRFAWRGDTGLIKQAERGVLYDRLVAEAGHANWDIKTGSIGTGWLLSELIKRPEFNVHRCPTALITW